MSNTPLGLAKHELDTPVLCVDLDVMEANLRAMAALCREQGVNWRPHSKCHKSPAVAHKLIEAGAIGVTCAKLGEAEVMAGGGVHDILIANLIVGPRKIERLVALRRIADPVVCIDHIDQARPISDAMEAAGLRLRVILEIDIGLNRVGVLPGEPSLQLARKVQSLGGLEFSGVMGYEGHLLQVNDQQEKATRIQESLTLLTQTKDLLESNGIPCPLVSCGGTGSLFFSVKQPGVNEVQAGGGVFMDTFYRNCCQVTQLDYALTILATVVGRPAPDRAIIDAGKKTMHTEYQPALVLDRPGVTVTRLSAEHGSLTLAPEAQDLKIGEQLVIVPGYSDLTMVNHNQMYGFRGDRLEVIWPLEARGKLA